MEGESKAITPPPPEDPDDDIPLTPEEIAERNKVPTWATPLFGGAVEGTNVINGNNMLGDIAPDPPDPPDPPES